MNEAALLKLMEKLPHYQNEYGGRLVPRCGSCKHYKPSNNPMLDLKQIYNPPINCRNRYACCSKWELAPDEQGWILCENQEDNINAEESVTMNVNERFNDINTHIEEEITKLTKHKAQQFGSIDSNTSATLSGIISGLKIAKSLLKFNEFTEENRNIYISTLKDEIGKIQNQKNKEKNIYGINFFGGQIQGIEDVIRYL